jgi:hypothetical protein
MQHMVYGLEGTLTWTVNDTEVQVGPGQALFFHLDDKVRPPGAQFNPANWSP